MQDSNDKGFALYGDVSEVVRDDLAGGTDLNDLFVDLDGPAVELLDEPKEFDKKDEEADDLADLDLTPGALEIGRAHV